MRFADVVVAAGARVGGEVVPARGQMATTLGFHIILACLLARGGSGRAEP
jgi:hypothetical protein